MVGLSGRNGKLQGARIEKKNADSLPGSAVHHERSENRQERSRIVPRPRSGCHGGMDLDLDGVDGRIMKVAAAAALACPVSDR